MGYWGIKCFPRSGTEKISMPNRMDNATSINTDCDAELISVPHCTEDPYPKDGHDDDENNIKSIRKDKAPTNTHHYTSHCIDDPESMQISLPSCSDHCEHSTMNLLEFRISEMLREQDQSTSSLISDLSAFMSSGSRLHRRSLAVRLSLKLSCTLFAKS